MPAIAVLQLHINRVCVCVNAVEVHLLCAAKRYVLDVGSGDERYEFHREEKITWSIIGRVSYDMAISSASSIYWR